LENLNCCETTQKVIGTVGETNVLFILTGFQINTFYKKQIRFTYLKNIPKKKDFEKVKAYKK
jgi:hypothetical protein